MSWYIRHSVDPVQHETGFKSFREAVQQARTKVFETRTAWQVKRGHVLLATVQPWGVIDYTSDGEMAASQ